MNKDIPTRSRATILVKAAPRVGKSHGELVCCAGIDTSGKWIRLYPVAFRTLEDAQKFKRWDIVEYDWRPPKGDIRSESRRLEHRSLGIIANVTPKNRGAFIAPHIVTSLEAVSVRNESLALLRPKKPKFHVVKKASSEFEAERNQFHEWHRQETEGLLGFLNKNTVPYEPSPYSFKYTYETDDGAREGTCQDWEVEATFLSWRRQYGEQQTLKEMQRVFGEEYPEKGFVLAMGTHKAYPQWLINGIIRADHGIEALQQQTLFT